MMNLVLLILSSVLFHNLLLQSFGMFCNHACTMFGPLVNTILMNQPVKQFIYSLDEQKFLEPPTSLTLTY